MFPPLVLLTGDTPVAMVAAEYYQALYKKHLGLDILIDAQIFKQRLAKMTSGDLFAAWNLNNRGRYNNPGMDALIRTAQSSLDARERMDAFGEIQQLIYDDAVIIPMYERGWSFMVDPRLKGFKRRSIGPEVDYNYAYIDAEQQ